MATTYTITVENYQGEKFTDQFDRDLRGTIAIFESDPELKLGHRVGTWADPYYKDDSAVTVRWYYYHNGRIEVMTRYNQLTANQRQGRRSY